MEKMDDQEKEVHLRHVLLYQYRQGNNAKQALKEICSVYGKESINSETCQFWYKRFRAGNLDIEEEDCGEQETGGSEKMAMKTEN